MPVVADVDLARFVIAAEGPGTGERDVAALAWLVRQAERSRFR